MNETRVDVLRHGEVEGGERYRGSTDDALTARGWEQMRAAVDDTCRWDCIISSPLKRCAEFAVELAGCHAVPLKLDARLREIHFGVWEGKTAAELLASHPDHLTRFWNDPVSNPPPEAETLLNFETRVLAAWHELSASKNGERVLIITHGGVIRAIVGHMQGLSWPERLGITVPHAHLIRSLCVWKHERGRHLQTAGEENIYSPPHFRGGEDAQRGRSVEDSFTPTATTPPLRGTPP